MHMQAASYPHIDKKSRRKQYRALMRQATPFKREKPIDFDAMKDFLNSNSNKIR